MAPKISVMAPLPGSLNVSFLHFTYSGHTAEQKTLLLKIHKQYGSVSARNAHYKKQYKCCATRASINIVTTGLDPFSGPERETIKAFDLQSLPTLLRASRIFEIKWHDIHLGSTRTKRAIEVIVSPLPPQKSNAGLCRKDGATLENERVPRDTRVISQ